MKSIRRATCAAWLFVVGSAVAAPLVGVTVEADRPGPVISKYLYGQSIGGLDGGMWVGPASPVANVRGWRKDVVVALRDLHVPLMRWPGGCAPDAYHWRDGIGARPHAVGTHEFFDLAEQVGADAGVTANVGTGSPREAADWIEYMTAGGASTLALLRARNGHPEPFKVAFFGLGNDNWGCGGDMTPEYYADLYNQYAVFIKARSGTPPRLVASGGDVGWTEQVGRKERIRDYRDVVGMRSGAEAAGDDVWAPALALADAIARHGAALDKNDPAGKVRLAVDDWATRDDHGGRRRQDALRDALAAALRFHVFHAHAGRLAMATIAQTVNVDQALVLTEGDRIVLTPTYYVFKMHVPFQDATALPVRLEHDPGNVAGDVAAPTVSASAARGRDGALYLSLVNRDPGKSVDVVVGVAGARAAYAGGVVLHAGSLDARNTFAAPAAVAPVPLRARAADGGRLRMQLPAASVAVVALRETAATCVERRRSGVVSTARCPAPSR
jgi:alpha-N-arabinofuranosidase